MNVLIKIVNLRFKNIIQLNHDVVLDLLRFHVSCKMKEI